MWKKNIKSAFRLLNIYPGDFDLLGITFSDEYYIDKCMPMDCSISCSTFENFSTFFFTMEVELEAQSKYLS